MALSIGKEKMKLVSFNMKPAQIEKLGEVVELVKAQDSSVNKSDVFREALERGLDSIVEELKTKG